MTTRITAASLVSPMARTRRWSRYGRAPPRILYRHFHAGEEDKRKTDADDGARLTDEPAQKAQSILVEARAEDPDRSGSAERRLGGGGHAHQPQDTNFDPLEHQASFSGRGEDRASSSLRVSRSSAATSRSAAARSSEPADSTSGRAAFGWSTTPRIRA